jgi:hypothetical protein
VASTLTNARTRSSKAAENAICACPAGMISKGGSVSLQASATCERHDINPEVYLTDVLIRLQDHPADRVAELLPHRWKETFGSGFTVARVVTPGDAA